MTSGMKRLLCAGLISLWFPVTANAMQPLDEEDMSFVTGQSGIALDLELRVNTGSDANPLGSMGNCEGVGNGCILALQFNNRDSGGGEWLVLKDFYGFMRINDLWLDANTMPDEDGDYANPDVFMDESNTCLISGCNVNGLPAFKMSFAGDHGVFEDDIEWHLNVGRMAVQYGAEGYLPENDSGKSFLGLRITDLQQNMARIDVDGSISMMGF